MSDTIFPVTVSAGFSFGSFPCVSAMISIPLNNVPRFSATVMSGGEDTGGVVTVQDIMSLGASAQRQMLSNPSESGIDITISGGPKGEVHAAGVITGVTVQATASGGLSCTVEGAGKDILLNMFSPAVYGNYIAMSAIREIQAGRPDRVNNSKIWVGMLDQKVLKKTDMSVSERIMELLKIATEKYSSMSMVDSLDSGLKTSIETILSMNDSQYKAVTEFLKGSNQTSKIFNEEVELDDLSNKNIFNGLHGALFETGGSFLDTLFNHVCPEFALWYVPDRNTSQSGKLMNQKYGDEDAEGGIQVPLEGVSYNTGQIVGHKPPTSAIVMRAPTLQCPAKDQQRSWFTNPHVISGIYPEKPTRDFGVAYTMQAPRWLSINPYATGLALTKSALQDIQEGRAPIIARNPTKAKEQLLAALKSNRKELTGSEKVLKYLAKKQYFRTLLQDSKASVSAPFTGDVAADVGKIYEVSGSPGGMLFNGLLEQINYTVNPGSMRTTLSFSMVTMPGVKVS